MNIFQFIKQFDNPDIQLYPLQKMILHDFYAGSLFNENLRAEYKAEYEEWRSLNTQLRHVYECSHDIKRELVAVLGRRSGKGKLSAIIACYEFFKLITYGYSDKSIASGDFKIVLVSGSKMQSSVLFRETLNFFRSMSSKSSIIYKIYNEGRVTAEKDGTTYSIVCTSESSESLLGISIYTVILDELGLMKNGEKVFNNLVPTIATYNDKLNPGKIVVFSSPREKDSFLYKYLVKSQKGKVQFQAPTWVANPRYTREMLREMEAQMTDEKFSMEYGAEFSDGKVDATDQITLRLPVLLIENIKKEARKIAYEEDRDVIYTDLIREVIERAYPR